MKEEMQSYGQKLAGVSINPSGDDRVVQAKQVYATLIDDLDRLRAEAIDPEVKRHAATAITYLQTAKMWHVGAITWK